MKRLATYLLLLIGFAFSVDAVDLSIQNESGCVKVSTINNTFRCAMFQWSTTLATNGWHDYHGYIAGAGENPCPYVFVDVTADNNRVFWRLRECAFP